MNAQGLENEQVLLALLREGDERAYSYLFKAFYQALFNYAGRVVHDEDYAHNIVQGVFCRFYENRKKIVIEGTLKSYLYRSVYNSCLDTLKHEKIKNIYNDQVLLDFYSKEIALAPEVELNLRREEIRKAIDVSINKLPERCRQIFVMSKIEEKSNQEIANELGISIKTVETQMRIALAKLRKDLGWLYYMIFLDFFSKMF
ncbi:MULTISPECIES: RNA polymerase sigma-70 factor [Butyricimonas]|uniref:RNA polymerase sigma-70 factor n=1 Tax=Butyricimonas TaxID=574697 RepID=UPI000363795F|nr:MULTISPECIES: RNA polymerase sigma-70 factor [Butyricimonas]